MDANLRARAGSLFAAALALPYERTERGAQADSDCKTAERARETSR